MNKTFNGHWLATFLLCYFLGFLGIHRFFNDKPITGVFQILTFGGFGIWTLIDLILIACGKFKDEYDNYITFYK